MKYTELVQICDFLKQYRKLDFVKRINDNVLCLSFDRQIYIFDLNKNESGIYRANLQMKDYNAPFDFALKKYFTNSFIKELKVLENNRVLRIKVELKKSYKSYESLIYFEFTGKNTNVIITDSKGLILEALRHIDKSYRQVKPNLMLLNLKPFKMDENFVKIEDFQLYFEEKFRILYSKKLSQYKNSKLTLLENKMTKLKDNLKNLEVEENLILEAKNLSKRADILFANLSVLKDYERNFSLLDFEGERVEFVLENSPKQSANAFYKMAKKLKQKAKNICIQRENLKEKLEFLDNLKHLIEKSESLFELEILLPKKSKKEVTKKDENELGVASFYFKDFKICVGKNEKGNEYLLKNTKKNDVWLHIKDVPSSHTFIIHNKQNISQEVLEFAAKLCVSFSKLNPGSVLVDYTTRNFVKVKEKAFVNYTNYKSIGVLKE
ncbi:NFACT RNA binding domain-containing protein [Campylobacter helveticus]|uniref:NFACT RNA binding domain-containing protein n=1 Tax=Campylobacter helveticus TaxID=28898 RepID=UPI0029428C1E|nr:NFACT RNA binding domain-containing protein [Campylobacter helveticus]